MQILIYPHELMSWHIVPFQLEPDHNGMVNYVEYVNTVSYDRQHARISQARRNDTGNATSRNNLTSISASAGDERHTSAQTSLYPRTIAVAIVRSAGKSMLPPLVNKVVELSFTLTHSGRRCTQPTTSHSVRRAPQTDDEQLKPRGQLRAMLDVGKIGTTTEKTHV